MPKLADTHGRAYARLSALSCGDKVTCDNGFICLPAGKVRTVRADPIGLFIRCAAGRHYLVGQLDDNSDALIGIYPAPIAK